jgi:hypothetical protein
MSDAAPAPSLVNGKTIQVPNISIFPDGGAADH